LRDHLVGDGRGRIRRLRAGRGVHLADEIIEPPIDGHHLRHFFDAVRY